MLLVALEAASAAACSFVEWLAAGSSATVA
jgi:hypothetical protein